jgi:nucleoside-diphosphate-sugar epimerase
MCRGSRHIHAVTSSLETVDIEIPQRKAITARYTLLLHTYNKRVKKYSCSFHSLRLIITIGSLIVPALLSVQYTNGNTIPSNISMEVYWIVWVLSLFVTISNGVVTLLKIDKKYYSLHTVYQQLLSEGWQYIHLTGKYNGQKTPGMNPTHENQYPHFCHSIDKIHMKSVEDEYYKVNTELTQKVFDAFLASDSKVFITLSSVKAVADEVERFLIEESIPNPITHYGKSKLLAEQYILSKEIPEGKRVYILRPCMIYGPGNKGNLNLLYKLVCKGIPWPLGAFENKRSFCSIDNLMFIIKELIERKDIPSGVYNVADDITLSTNEVISILAESQNKKPKIWNIPKGLIKSLAKLGDIFHLPLTTERLQKLTESYVVSNQKIKSAIGKPLPVSAKDGLLKTFNSFHNSAQ